MECYPSLRKDSGPGDISAEFIARGALVTGVDTNEELLAAARKRCPNGSFENQDIEKLSLPPHSFDGLWCSFTAAYFIEFEQVLSNWLKLLKDSAWICIVEIDDLLGHDPLPEKTRSLIEAFYEDALRGKRYDFKAGRKLRPVLERLGFQVTQAKLTDKELSFVGAAGSDVIQAWRDRFDRMGGLRVFLGNKHTQFVEEFTGCLSSESHLSRCEVVACIGTRSK